ncbi:TPA: hypothetical protein ACGUPI_004755 [Vibrio vulnificus]
MKIAVIYFTKTDVTGKLAQEVIKGICGAERMQLFLNIVLTERKL